MSYQIVRNDIMEEYHSIREAVRHTVGNDAEIVNSRPVFGGDINNSECLILNTGDRLFVKQNASADRSFFRAEADGLEAIRSTNAIGVPEVLACGRDGKTQFLLMEYIESESGRRPKDYWEILGRQLARMHQSETSAFTGDGKFGFYEDNFIGRNRQMNRPCAEWIPFFRDCRLLPQARMAERYFNAKNRERFQNLLNRLDEYLVEPLRPSLLHGDLWNGNVMQGNDGYAILIDPAVYVGHAEADLAMTELFGGFPEAFYRAYEAVHPLQPGYRDRRDIYNLYHLLNHTNLFGAGYFSYVEEILKRF